MTRSASLGTSATQESGEGGIQFTICINVIAVALACSAGQQLENFMLGLPDTSNLLKVLSFFDPESIPLNMITQGMQVMSYSQFSSNGSLVQLELKTLLALILSLSII
jgi:hypothetical protein